GLRHGLAAAVHAPVHRGVILRIGAVDGVDHPLRLLGRRGGVEIHQFRLAEQHGELGAVVHHAPAPVFCGPRTISRRRSVETVVKASRWASSSIGSMASATKASVSSALASAGSMPRVAM